MRQDSLMFFIGLVIGLCVGFILCGTGHAEPRPAVIMPPSGQPLYLHAPPSPTGPTVILPPAAPPIYVHPAPAPYAPATIVMPGEMPTFVYPGVNP